MSPYIVIVLYVYKASQSIGSVMLVTPLSILGTYWWTPVCLLGLHSIKPWCLGSPLSEGPRTQGLHSCLWFSFAICLYLFQGFARFSWEVDIPIHILYVQLRSLSSCCTVVLSSSSEFNFSRVTGLLGWHQYYYLTILFDFTWLKEMKMTKIKVLILEVFRNPSNYTIEAKMEITRWVTGDNLWP